MSFLRRLGFFRRNFDRELDEEMRLHMELRAAEIGPAEARRRFGNPTVLAEEARDAWGWRWLHDLGQDLRYGARTLARNPGFTLVAVLALALGVGANTAILSVVKGVLLRPLPYADPDRLVTILHYGTGPVGPAPFLDWRTQARSFERMGAAEYWAANLSAVDRPDKVLALRITPDVLPVLGVAPRLGRVFTDDEGQPGRDHVVVLGWDAFQRRFAGDPATVGRRIVLDGESYTIVGVMPPGFGFAPFWATRAEMWAPLALGPRAADRFGWSLRVFARLAPGVTLAQARAELATITGRLERAFPGSNKDIQVVPLAEKVVGPVRPALLVLLGAVGFVLLAACANVAHMLLARAQARRREIVLRTALGAGRGRLVRQFLAESLLLALLGGAVGAVLGVWGVDLLRALDPADVPRVADVGVDTTVFLIMLAVTVAAGVGFGLAPALRATAVDLAGALRGGGGEAAPSGGLRKLLVASQFALALPLLVGSGLMIRSFVALAAIDPGFDARGVVAMQISVIGSAEMQPGRRAVFFPELLRRVAALPGVTAAGAINHLPLAGDNWGWSVVIEGRPRQPPGEEDRAVFRAVLPGYFRAMAIPLVRGRDVGPGDVAGAAPVAVVNQRFAETYWPGADPIGKRFAQDDSPGALWFTVVGVARDVRQSDWAARPGPEMYVPVLQTQVYTAGERSAFAYLTLVARGPDPDALVAPIREAVRGLAPAAVVSDVATLDDVVRNATARPRFYLVLLTAFAALALLLAAVGSYGVMSYAVSRRTQEIGIRMALGARRRDVLRLIVGQGLALALGGAAVGLVLAVALARLMRGMLYGVGPADPATLLGVALVLGVVAAAANLVPARRATRVDPVLALRSE